MRNIFRGKKKTKSLNPNQLKKIENVFSISKTSKISYNTLPQPQISVIREKLAILRSHLRKAKPPRRGLGEKLKNFKNLAINIRLAYLRFKLKNPKVLINRISCICKKCGFVVSKATGVENTENRSPIKSLAKVFNMFNLRSHLRKGKIRITSILRSIVVILKLVFGHKIFWKKSFALITILAVIVTAYWQNTPTASVAT